jgi:nucleoside 2-deoxyribosyltransferase
MHGDWQDCLINKYPDVIFIDPRSHGLSDPADYTKWDLAGVLDSDGVIAYISKNNPSGVGAALEIGFALDRGTPVLLVCEKEDRYFDIVKCAATANFTDIMSLIDTFDIMGGLNFDTINTFRLRNQNKIREMFIFYREEQRKKQ